MCSEDAERFIGEVRNDDPELQTCCRSKRWNSTLSRLFGGGARPVQAAPLIGAGSRRIGPGPSTSSMSDVRPPGRGVAKRSLERGIKPPQRAGETNVDALPTVGGRSLPSNVYCARGDSRAAGGSPLAFHLLRGGHPHRVPARFWIRATTPARATLRWSPRRATAGPTLKVPPRPSWPQPAARDSRRRSGTRATPEPSGLYKTLFRK